jgi:GntR family transcriptional regulator/MocR family aminotransferase
VPTAHAPAKTWRELAAEGKFKEALAAVGGDYDAICARGSSADLLALGDAARFAGDSARAQQAYDQLVAEGWLEGRHGSGTYVAASGSRRAARTHPAARLEGPATIRHDTGTPRIDPRHTASWRRAWRDLSTATPPRRCATPRRAWRGSPMN